MYPPLGGSFGGMPCRFEILTPQRVLLLRVYGTPAVLSISHPKGYGSCESTVRSPYPCGLICGFSLLRRRPLYWIVYRVACHRLLPWPRLPFAMDCDAAWLGSHHMPWGTAPPAGLVPRIGRPTASDPWCVVCGHMSLGRSRCARVCGFRVCGVHACSLVYAPGIILRAVSVATWHLFTGVCPRCLVRAVSVATWRTFTGVHTRRTSWAVPVATLRLFTSPPMGGF